MCFDIKYLLCAFCSCFKSLWRENSRPFAHAKVQLYFVTMVIKRKKIWLIFIFGEALLLVFVGKEIWISGEIVSFNEHFSVNETSLEERSSFWERDSLPKAPIGKIPLDDFARTPAIAISLHQQDSGVQKDNSFFFVNNFYKMRSRLFVLVE